MVGYTPKLGCPVPSQIAPVPTQIPEQPTGKWKDCG